MAANYFKMELCLAFARAKDRDEKIKAKGAGKAEKQKKPKKNAAPAPPPGLQLGKGSRALFEFLLDQSASDNGLLAAQPDLTNMGP